MSRRKCLFDLTCFDYDGVGSLHAGSEVGVHHSCDVAVSGRTTSGRRICTCMIRTWEDCQALKSQLMNVLDGLR